MSEPTIAIAFGAGGARGLAHIHAIKAMDELGIKPVAISGTSIGSIIGTGYASGMLGSEIEEYVLDRFSNRVKILADLMKLRPDSIKDFLADGGPRLGDINIERVIEQFLPDEIPANFSDLFIPTQIIATDYYGHCDKVFSKGLIHPAISASAAIPAVFKPVNIEDRYLVDGGMTNPVPFEYLDGKADIILAIDVAGGPEGEPSVKPGKIDAIYASPQLMQITIANEKAKLFKVDALLRPSMGDIRVMDFMRSQSILQKTAYFKDEVKTTLDRLIAGFKKL